MLSLDSHLSDKVSPKLIGRANVAVWFWLIGMFRQIHQCFHTLSDNSTIFRVVFAYKTNKNGTQIMLALEQHTIKLKGKGCVCVYCAASGLFPPFFPHLPIFDHSVFEVLHLILNHPELGVWLDDMENSKCIWWAGCRGFYLESRRHTAAPGRTCSRLRRLWICSRGDDSYAVIPYWLWDNGHCIVQRGLVIFFASLPVFPLSWCVSHVSALPSLHL